MSLPYLDPSIPARERARDLVSRMTLEEKVSQMGHEAPAIERLGVPAYGWWNEALHGVSRAGRATVFPQSIGLAATWDSDLIHRIAVAISDEARAKHHAAIREGRHGDAYTGLTIWSPTVNLLRDPRWGRGQETYGEDPYLTGRLGVAYVRGLQGNDPRYLKTVATPKHFAAHNGPEHGRAGFDALVTAKDLEESFLPHFRDCVVEGRAASVMAAYNRLNGTPCAAHADLLEGVLRQRWGFDGFVTSDCGAVEQMHSDHGTAECPCDAAAQSVRAGTDLCCGSAYGTLLDAVADGRISEAEIDRACVRLFEARMRLGMFDPAAQVPYASIPESVVGCDAHRALAREAAQKAIVMLHNDGFLPMPLEGPKIFMTGPTAASLEALWGNYNGYADSMVTLLEGVVARIPAGRRLSYRAGCRLGGPPASSFGIVDFEIADAGLVIACLGLSPEMEGEEGDSTVAELGGDRTSLALPEAQVAYLRYLLDRGLPVVLVLTGGSPIVLPPEAFQCRAVLWVGYPGQEGGHSLADILFGAVAPSGRLPFTVPAPDAKLPPIGDYRMDGRTYRFDDREPQCAFGSGLSTTQFEFTGLVVEPDLSSVSVTVANVGPRAGATVVQVYVRHREAKTRVPRHALAGFQRVELAPGAEVRVTLALDPRARTVVLDDGTRLAGSGEVTVFAGEGQPGSPGVLEASLTLP